VIPLRSGTVAYDARGTRRPVGGRGERLDLSPGTRLAADLPETSPQRRRSAEFDEGTAAWRDGLAASLPHAPLLHDLAASALQDLWILGDGLPAPVAGWSPSWRYLWPRDAAFCAVPTARSGWATSTVPWRHSRTSSPSRPPTAGSRPGTTPTR